MFPLHQAESSQLQKGCQTSTLPLTMLTQKVNQQITFKSMVVLPERWTLTSSSKIPYLKKKLQLFSTILIQATSVVYYYFRF